MSWSSNINIKKTSNIQNFIHSIVPPNICIYIIIYTHTKLNIHHLSDFECQENCFQSKNPEVLPNSGVVLNISYHLIIYIYIPQNHTNPFPQRSVILTTPGARHLCFYITPVEAIEPPPLTRAIDICGGQPLWAGPMPRNVHPFARLHVPTSCDPAVSEIGSIRPNGVKPRGCRVYPE